MYHYTYIITNQENNSKNFAQYLKCSPSLIQKRLKANNNPLPRGKR